VSQEDSVDRDVVNAIHALYQCGQMDTRELLDSLWCGPDSEPDLDGIADREGSNFRLSKQLIRFIKATEEQLSALPRPDFVFGFPLSHPPRKNGETRRAFVAMPYRPSWFPAVRDAITGAAASTGFAAEVSLDLGAPGLIPNQIWTGIRFAEVVVADITGNNPNVFYELGLAHALGKEVILLAQGDEHAPFDVSTSRVLRYDINALAALAANLQSAFASVPARYAYEGPQPRF
jgi:hypothetical protein